MASAGSVFVDLLLRDAKYREGWNRARNYTHAGSRQIQGDLGKVNQSFQGVINPINNIGTAVRNLAVTFAGAFSVQQLVKYSDTWKQLGGRLAVVTSEFETVGGQQERLFEIAQKTRQPLENIISFYSRLKQFIPEAERAQYDLFTTTEGVATALALTGEISESATAAMIQLTQAIGTNFEAAGQELRSLQEQAPRLTRAIQNAFGDGTMTLQQLVKAGILTRETFLNIFRDGSFEAEKLRMELEKMPVTVAQAFTRLDNAFLKFIGQSEEIGKVTGTLSLAITKLADNLDTVAKAAVVVSIALFTRSVPAIVSFTKEFLKVRSAATAYQIAMSSVSASNVAAITSAERLGAAMNKLRIAAIGTASETAVVVGKSGQAITASFSSLAKSVGFLSASWITLKATTAGIVAALGGLPVILAAGTAAVFLYRKEIKGWADDTQLLGINIGSVLDAYGDAAKQIFSGIKLLIVGTIEGILASFETLSVKAKVLAFNVINDLNQIPGFNIDNSGLLLDISEPGKLEASLRSAAESFGMAWQGVQERISKDIAEDMFQPVVRAQATQQSNTTATTGTPDNEALKKRNQFLEKYKELLSGLDSQTFRQIEAEKELNKAYENGWININQLYTALEGLDAQYRQNSESVDQWAVDIEQFSKRAAENIQDTFADFLFDPFQDGLKGMVKGFVDSVRRMIAEAQAAKLARLLLGDSVEGGTGEGIFGSVLKGIGGFIFGKPEEFADGGYLGPGKWGIAGEAGAELLYGGKTGVSVFNQDQIGKRGNTYNIDARGTDQSVVRRLEQSLLALAGPGVIENRVISAQSRGSL